MKNKIKNIGMGSVRIIRWTIGALVVILLVLIAVIQDRQLENSIASEKIAALSDYRYCESFSVERLSVAVKEAEETKEEVTEEMMNNFKQEVLKHCMYLAGRYTPEVQPVTENLEDSGN